MQKDQSDQELHFKKRARRRLVGAIALVLLMIILLPMVLKDRASQQAEKITITLPNEASTTVTPSAAPTSSEFDSNIIPSESDKPAEAAAEVADNAANQQTSDNQEASAKQETSAKPEIEKPEAKKPAAEKPTVAKPEVAKPEAPKPENSKPEPAKPEVAKAESQKPVSAKKFYVQIGVFSDPANVKQLQAKLSDLGYKSQTEKIKTDKGEKIRLKTNVFADRNEAAIALTNIKDAGLTGMVVSQ